MATPAERVRRSLGESIPAGGLDSDTLFTNAQIDDLLTDNGNDIDAAILQGWRDKAAAYADLVDTAEGTSKRSMSDLHKNALRMVEVLSSGSSTGGTTSGRTRIRQIVRR
jgi:hypothetical protein